MKTLRAGTLGGTLVQFEVCMTGRRRSAACRSFSAALMLGAALTMPQASDSAPALVVDTAAASLASPAAGAADVTVHERDGVYHVAATFSVPQFLLKRLLKRDAQEMIRRLKDEIGRAR